MLVGHEIAGLLMWLWAEDCKSKESFPSSQSDQEESGFA